MFQSAPRPCGRGDASVRRVNAIMAPFQSAPRPCGRGDRHARTRERRRLSFNPRLARAGEATGYGAYAFHVRGVSIRASPVRARRPDIELNALSVIVVSIRASPVRARRPGESARRMGAVLVSIRASPVRARRRGNWLGVTSNNGFQSAPRPCGRGDVTSDAIFNLSHKVSIRASPVRARRQLAERSRAVAGHCFNPRLARAGEATAARSTG